MGMADKDRFIQISTDEVYGSSNTECTESSKLNPSSPYSSSKASADLIALSYFKSFGFPVLITRSSNNFGENQFPEKLIPKAFVTLSKNEEFYIYGNGENLRDWLYVEDNVKAIELVLEKGNVGEIYNICAHNEISNNKVVKQVLFHCCAPFKTGFLDAEIELLLAKIYVVKRRRGEKKARRRQLL